ncbi:MAG TPA: NUDIX hydrolase [Anaerolineae bacterium]|nr:NUDIX hydrolase [Anaerolineae bacterium]HOU24078.1 NUDIX hydrolase [Anaerolineae bacterium]HQJ51779.1 NUDIX hydrolase [Anaerolineae bacterium]
MGCPHRIAAGGLVVRDGRILLVRYPHGEGSFLVAPGGAIADGESLARAAEREVQEETGVLVRARAPVMIENLRARRYQMVKVWYLCDDLGGEVRRTPEADREGITRAAWYTDAELAGETVYPDIVLTLGIEGVRTYRGPVFDPPVRVADF